MEKLPAVLSNVPAPPSTAFSWWRKTSLVDDRAVRGDPEKTAVIEETGGGGTARFEGENARLFDDQRTGVPPLRAVPDRGDAGETKIGGGFVLQDRVEIERGPAFHEHLSAVDESAGTISRGLPAGVPHRQTRALLDVNLSFVVRLTGDGESPLFDADRPVAGIVVTLVLAAAAEVTEGAVGEWRRARLLQLSRVAEKTLAAEIPAAEIEDAAVSVPKDGGGVGDSKDGADIDHDPSFIQKAFRPQHAVARIEERLGARVHEKGTGVGEFSLDGGDPAFQHDGAVARILPGVLETAGDGVDGASVPIMLDAADHAPVQEGSLAGEGTPFETYVPARIVPEKRARRRSEGPLR